MWRDIKRREREALLHQQYLKERDRLEAMHRKPVRIPSRIPSARVLATRKSKAPAPIRTGVVQADPPTISPVQQTASTSSDDTAAVIGLVALGVALYDAANDRPSTASCNNDGNTPFSSGGGGDYGGGGADASWSDSSSDSSSSFTSGD